MTVGTATHKALEEMRVMTDNGSCYRSEAFRDACRQLGLRHFRIKPYSSKTNGVTVLLDLETGIYTFATAF